MKTLEQIKAANQNDDFYAIGENSKKYEATYTTKYGGIMFFCIPSNIKILGYIERN